MHKIFCCKSHCKICSSVECTREADDAFSSCICFGYLYCILICLCTAVCKECFQFITFAWHKFVEPISKFNVTTVCHHIENAVKIFFCLILNSFHDLRSAVADVENADTSDKIKKDVSVNIFEHCALSTLDTYRICIATERFRQCVVPFFKSIQAFGPGTLSVIIVGNEFLSIIKSLLFFYYGKFFPLI